MRRLEIPPVPTELPSVYAASDAQRLAHAPCECFAPTGEGADTPFFVYTGMKGGALDGVIKPLLHQVVRHPSPQVLSRLQSICTTPAPPTALTPRDRINIIYFLRSYDHRHSDDTSRLLRSDVALEIITHGQRTAASIWQFVKWPTAQQEEREAAGEEMGIPAFPQEAVGGETWATVLESFDEELVVDWSAM